MHSHGISPSPAGPATFSGKATPTWPARTFDPAASDSCFVSELTETSISFAGIPAVFVSVVFFSSYIVPYSEVERISRLSNFSSSPQEQASAASSASTQPPIYPPLFFVEVELPLIGLTVY
ncbi:hypothetical protein TrVGV298_003805 [Trichoderma virens]|nr:hypothetical protein TrVGV298_003805 [Trichoderma virens]